MSIGQFLIIFWARRVLILAATASCLIGALIVTAILPPQWKATERLMLDFVKPDPITGLVMQSPQARAYLATQMELITDYSVAGKVAEQVGWLTDPVLTAQYNKRAKDDKRDFRHWTADIVIKNTKVTSVQDSNILEIAYTAPTPEEAIAVTDALRKAYMEASLQFRRQDAERNAVWYTEQSAKAKETLDQAIATEGRFERENGLVMQDKTDVESTHLQSLSVQSTPFSGVVAPSLEGSQASMQLADIEAQLATAQTMLGPNNPEVISLQSKRALMKSLIERDKAATRASLAQAQVGGQRALEQAVQAQKAKVIANSEKIGVLNQLHQDVERARDAYNKMQEKGAQFRQEAVSGDVGITLLGNATTPKSAAFPNYLLIVPGSLVLGLGVGVFVSLLMELLRRRVRTQEDLVNDEDLTFICAVPGPDSTKSRSAKSRGWRLSLAGNRGTVSA